MPTSGSSTSESSATPAALGPGMGATTRPLSMPGTTSTASADSQARGLQATGTSSIQPPSLGPTTAYPIRPTQGQTGALAARWDAQERVTTQRPPVSALGNESVKVEVSCVISKVSSGFIKTSRTFYVLLTSPQKWQVEREYKDIMAFRELLCKRFPGYAVH
jgi:hypothetical protein